MLVNRLIDKKRMMGVIDSSMNFSEFIVSTNSLMIYEFIDKVVDQNKLTATKIAILILCCRQYFRIKLTRLGGDWVILFFEAGKNFKDFKAEL